MVLLAQNNFASFYVHNNKFVLEISGMLLNGLNHSQSWVIARISVVPQTVEFAVAQRPMLHQAQLLLRHLQQQPESQTNCDEVCRAAPAFSAQRILPPLVKTIYHHQSRFPPFLFIPYSWFSGSTSLSVWAPLIK